MLINHLKHNLKTHTTSAGFKVTNVKIEGYPIAASSVWLNVGSSQDPLQKLGLAHFFEHLLFTRTKNNPDRQKRLEEIEKHGFIFDAFTSLEYQHYFYIHSPQESKNALNFLTDGLANSIFEEADVKREKQIIFSEEKQNHNDPAAYIWRLANRGMWGEELLGKDFYGTSKTLNSIGKEDLQEFYNNFFTVSNIRFVFINSNLPDKLQDKLIDNMRMDLNNSYPFMETKTYESIKNKIVFEKMATENCQLSLSFLIKQVSNIKEKALQDFIVDYLDSGWTSRFIQRMRIEENLAYWVYSDSSNLSSTGYIRFTLSTATKNVDKILKIFKDEINQLNSLTLSVKVLEMHKTKFLSDILRNSTEYNWLMQWYGFTSLVNGKPISLDQYCSEINKITSRDILKFAKNYMTDDRFSIAYIASNKISFEMPIFQ